MKKRKKRNISIVVVTAIALIIVVACYLNFFTSPDYNNLNKNYQNDNLQTILVTRDTPILGAALKLSDLDATITSIQENNTFIIYFYQNSSKASSEYEKLKSNNENSELIKRGNAIYVGDKKPANKFSFHLLFNW